MGIRNFVAIKASFERIRELFNYDFESGYLTWKIKLKHHHKSIQVGSRVGWIDGDYRRASIDGQQHLEHRIIWFWMTGEDDPTVEIDHKDRDGRNNKWTNLRQATPAQNQANKPRGNKPNKFGYKGIGITNSGKYFACISKNGKWTHLGVFFTPEEAHNKYCEEAKKLYGDYFHNGRNQTNIQTGD